MTAQLDLFADRGLRERGRGDRLRGADAATYVRERGDELIDEVVRCFDDEDAPTCAGLARRLGIDGIIARARDASDRYGFGPSVYLESWDAPHLRPPLGDLRGMLATTVACDFCGVLETHHGRKPYPCDAEAERAVMRAKHERDCERYVVGASIGDEGHLIVRYEHAEKGPRWLRDGALNRSDLYVSYYVLRDAFAGDRQAPSRSWYIEAARPDLIARDREGVVKLDAGKLKAARAAHRYAPEVDAGDDRDDDAPEPIAPKRRTFTKAEREAIRARNDAERAAAPVGENVIPKEPRVDCEFSDRCSFRALHRCPSCRRALCNNHAKHGDDARHCVPCGARVTLPCAQCNDAGAYYDGMVNGGEFAVPCDCGAPIDTRRGFRFAPPEPDEDDA